MAEEKILSAQELSEQELIRREKLQGLMDNNLNPYEITKFDVTHASTEVIANYESLQETTVSVAGRMIGRHVMGKASFARLMDGQGKIQLYFKRDDVGEEAYAAFKKYDLGDVIGVTGTPFVTKTGEISVAVKTVTLLAKCLKPLPEKFHGLTDMDLRYRQRYLDMIVNPEVKDTFVKRSRIMRELRDFLDGRGFLEVDTPI
ncbi:MAG: lysine--tRNA ligase, partial [Clostridia bacterium]|nr:lysine--tRNA ligase [Clostridia bacterium]